MRRPATLILCLVLVFAVAASEAMAQTRGQTRRARGQAAAAQRALADRPVKVQYAGVEIQRVIREIAEATNTRIVFGDDVRGVVTITVAKPVSQAEALELLRAALFIKGYAQLPAGDDAYKVVPIAATPTDSAFVQGELERGSERAITTLRALQHADAGEVAETIKTIAPSSGAVVAFSPTNSLILSGTESALGRLLAIVDVMDEAATDDLLARVIRYRDVDEMIDLADEALNAGWSRSGQIEFFSDARTNMLIAQASPERLAELREFIETFDRFTVGGGRIYVMRVLNRDPDEIIGILGDLQSGSEVLDVGPQEGADAEVAAIGGSLAGADFNLTADAPTRSIIIQAEPSVIQQVVDVITELDRVAPRVSVEVYYYEVERPSGYLISFDFTALVAPKGRDDLAFAISSKPSGSQIPTSPQGGGAFGTFASDPITIDIVDPNTGLSIPITLPTNQAAVEASASDVRADLLSRPTLTVASGEEHEIFVGNNIPIPVSSGNQGLTTEVPTEVPTDGQFVANPLVQTQTIERVDVGTSLFVRPTVSETGEIRLGLTFEEKQVRPSLAGNPRDVGVTLLNRTLESTANVRPGEYVLFGMQEERSTRYIKSGIPWLMNLPLIGFFVSRTEEQSIDSQILIAVKARLLRSPADDIAETIRRRMAMERSLSRVVDLGTMTETPWAVRLATFEYEVDARRVAEGFEADGYVSRVTRWEGSDRAYWDVYLTSYSSFEDASIVASQAIEADWDGEILLLPAINRMAPDE